MPSFCASAKEKAVVGNSQLLVLATSDNLAVPLSSVLAARLGQRAFIPTIAPQSAGNTSLPVLPNAAATMIAGQLYPSSGDANQRLYLPLYEISLVEILPSSAGGTLTANLIATAPSPPAGVTVAIVPHVLRAQLSYTLLNEKGNPTTIVRRDFAPVSAAANPLSRALTLTIGSPGDLGQIVLALKNPTWSPMLTLTANMSVAIPSSRFIFVDKAALYNSMTIDPAKLETVNLTREVSLLAKPAAASAVARLAPPVAGSSPMVFDPLRAPPVAAAASSPLRAAALPIRFLPSSAVRPAPGLLPAPLARPLPGPIEIPPILRIPRPPNLPPPVLPPTRLVTVTGQTVLSLSLAPPVHVDVPLTGVTLPANTGMTKVPCDGLDLWIDETVPHNFYYLPRTFHLGLASVSGTHVPTLLVAFDGSGTDPAAIDTDLTMQLMPNLDPRDRGRLRSAASAELARRGLSGSPNLAVQEPPITQLEWWVPSASGADQSQASPAPHASFEVGLSATLTMSYPQFQRIVDRFLVPWSDGLQGEVRYASPDDPSLTQSVPIVVNLRSFVGAPVVVTVGAATAGQVSLTLANTLECDVLVGGTATLPSGSGNAEVALRDASGVSLAGGLVIAAQGSVTVVATWATGSPPPADEVGIVWEAAPTREQLVAMCASFIGTNCDAPLSVPLDVETLPGYFRTGTGDRRLVKLEVEFTESNPSTKVELTATALKTTANLVPPILLELLNDPGARRFTYQVTNVYDDNTRTPGANLSWEGGSPLVVEANPPEGRSHDAA
jgi:hypothetical protein